MNWKMLSWWHKRCSQKSQQIGIYSECDFITEKVQGFGLIIISIFLFSSSSENSNVNQNVTINTEQNDDYVQMMDKCTDILQRVQKHVQHSDKP